MSGTVQEPLYFLDFVLDPANARLSRDAQPISLRPKSLGVLVYLASRPGRLVTKDELLAGVWPDTAVTEWVLTGCIRELRQALGDDARQPRAIETVHRRGYRFVAAVRESASRTTPPSPSSTDLSPADSGLVGRAAELEELGRWLSDTLEGRRQIGLIAGEPGIGKTSLVDAFVTSLIAQKPEILVARGQCIDQHGSGEPYLPVLDALGRLCNGPRGNPLVELLRQHAPSWLVQLPGVLEIDEARALDSRLGAGSRQRMLREIVAWMEVLPHPLVLVLEDLHWSDNATLGLLSSLAQRRDPARLLLLGTYRPVDVAVRNHPLRALHHELRARGLCRDLWLQPLTEESLAEYLRWRWPGLDGVTALAQVVHAHTDGNPLFLVNVANALTADRVVVESGQGWVLRDDVSRLSLGVPQGLRQMIAARIDRLNDAERETLAAGSLIGRTFSSALVAAALDVEVLRVEERLARLGQREEIVAAAGEVSWPDGTASGSYRFLHALYQAVLRDRVPPTLRRRLHQRTADRLEAAFGRRSAEVAAELAFHFDAGGLADRAVVHIETAAERAMRLGAALEASNLLRRGLVVLDGLEPTPERTHCIIHFCIRLARALPAVHGYAHPEITAAYERARRLSEQTDDKAGLFQAFLGLAVVSLAGGRFDRTAEAVTGFSDLLTVMPFREMKLAAHFLDGMLKYHTGPLAEARLHLEKAMRINQAPLPAFSINPVVVLLAYLSTTLMHLGHPDQARQRLAEAAQLSDAAGRLFDRANVHEIECVLAILLRDDSTLARVAPAALAMGDEHDVGSAAAVGMVGRGLCVAHTGAPRRGIELIRAGMETYRAGGHLVLLPFLLGTLAGALLDDGDIDGALGSIDEARRVIASTREQRAEVELHRLEGVAHLRLGDVRAAERCLRTAIDLARHQGARWLELRSATTLAQLSLGSGQPGSLRRRARRDLATILDCIKEGADTLDVREAMAAWKQL